MNKLLLVIGVLGLLSSSDKLKELASAYFSINGDALIVKVPPSGSASSISFSSETETIDFEAEIKKNNAELAAKYIKSLAINSMELEIIFPAKTLPNNFKNVKSYTYNSHSDVKADQIKILSPDTFSPGGSQLNLPLNTALDMKYYIKEKVKFTYAFTGVLPNPTTDTLEIKIKANYQIKVGI